MSSSFSIHYKWLRKGRTKEPERAAQADISILANETCLTHNVELLHAVPHDYARLSAFHLSRWFAENWWRLFWEPGGSQPTPEWQMRHNIGAVGGGYVWPNLSFTSDWNTISIRSTPTAPRAAEPIYYTKDYRYFISASDFEQGIADFVNATIDRLSMATPSYKDLAILWNEVVEERHDPEAAQWRKLEACLGYDPDEAPEGLLESLQGEYSKYGAPTVHELAAGSGSQALNHLRDLVADIEMHGSLVRVPQYKDVQERLAGQPTDPNVLPWQRAVQAAKAARQVWGLNSGPIRNDMLAEILGLELTESYMGKQDDTQRLPLSAGMRNDDVEDGFRISLHQRHPHGRRFMVARLVGDYVGTQQGETLMPATNTYTSRQKFQRAFAQEFLCPWDELSTFLHGESLEDDDINDAAGYFEVSPLLVTTTLVNKGWLDQGHILGDMVG